jgi:thiamine biosynthesis lipoprotein
MSACHIAFKAMGARCEIVLDGLAEPEAHRLAAPAMAEVLRIEQKYSRYLPQSVVSRINDAAGSDPVAIDAETYQLLGYAHSMFEQSRGAFDLTAGVLRKAWDFKSGQLPSQAQIDALLPLVGWPRVEVSEQALRLPEAGMEIDFGGFGKEYAVDRAAAVLESQGVKSGYVNLAGDMRFLGPKADDSPWQIGIQHPREEGRVLAHIPMETGALATSGDYERAIWVDGKPYCHVLNARTGWPVSAWQTVSVVAPLALMAGTVSTVAMLLEGQGLAFLQQNPFNFLAVDAQGQVHRPHERA